MRQAFLGLQIQAAVAGPFIVDFACLRHKRIVEADGGQYADAVRYDNARKARLEAQGFQVLRFWNNEILRDAIACWIRSVASWLDGAEAGRGPQPRVSTRVPPAPIRNSLP
ncbi:DUF559 domain-containing protein [Luteimonas cucumeris]|uniref:DUF559 domain-containing protein n=1 Tax=Luteimonas cucumeris TaxID=985012 RepID=UPI0018F67D6D